MDLDKQMFIQYLSVSKQWTISLFNLDLNKN